MAMTPPDEQRFAKLINDFVDGCGFEKPFHTWSSSTRAARSASRVTASNKSAAVRRRRTGCGCCRRLVISSGGCGKSAKIQIVAAAPTMQ